MPCKTLQRIAVASFLVIYFLHGRVQADNPAPAPTKILRGIEELTVDPVGNISGQADLVLPEDFYRRFKTLMSQRETVQENGKSVVRLHEPSIANVLRYLGVTSTAYETPEISGEFDDEAATIHARYRILGRSAFRHGRWVVALGVGFDANTVTVHKFETAKQSCLIELRARQSGLQLISRLKVSLPEGASAMEFSKKTLELSYTAPVPTMPASNGASRPEMRFEAKPQLMSALYKLYGNPRWNELFAGRAVLQNDTHETLSDYRIRFRINGYANWGPWERSDKVYPGQTVIHAFHPVFESHIWELKGSTPALAEIEYEYTRASGEKVTETESTRIKLLGMNEAVWSNLETTENSSWFEMFRSAPMVVSSFTSATDPVVQDIVGLISKSTAGKGAVTTDANALKFLGTLYNLLAANVAYETTPGGVEDGLIHQHLKYGRDVLRTHSGTCINLSILYASVCEAAGLDAYVVIVPGHAFAAAKLPQSGIPVAVETTCCGGGTKETSRTFVQARESAFRTYQKWAADGRIVEIDIASYRKQGVAPPELPGVGPNPLKDWGIQAPEEVKETDLPFLLVTVKQALEEIEIKYSPVANQTAVAMDFNLKEQGAWTTYATTFENSMMLVFSTQIPVVVPENRRAAVGTVLSQMNTNLWHGSFVLLKDGKIEYRTTTNCMRGTLAPSVVKSELQYHFDMMKNRAVELRQLAGGSVQQPVETHGAPGSPVPATTDAGTSVKAVASASEIQNPVIGIWRTMSTDQYGNQYTQMMALLADGKYVSVMIDANGRKTELQGTWTLEDGQLTTRRSDGQTRKGAIQWNGRNRFNYSTGGGSIAYERVT